MYCLADGVPSGGVARPALEDVGVAHARPLAGQQVDHRVVGPHPFLVCTPRAGERTTKFSTRCLSVVDLIGVGGVRRCRGDDVEYASAVDRGGVCAVAEIAVQCIAVALDVADLLDPEASGHSGDAVVVNVAVGLVGELRPPSSRVGHRGQDTGLHRLLVRSAVSSWDGQCHYFVGIRVVVDRHVRRDRRDQSAVFPAVVEAPSVDGPGVPRHKAAFVGEGVGL